MFLLWTLNCAQYADVIYDLYECVLVVLDAHRSLQRLSWIDGLAPPPIAKQQQLKTTRFSHQKARKQQRVYLARQARLQIVPS